MGQAYISRNLLRNLMLWLGKRNFPKYTVPGGWVEEIFQNISYMGVAPPPIFPKWLILMASEGWKQSIFFGFGAPIDKKAGFRQIIHTLGTETIGSRHDLRWWKRNLAKFHAWSQRNVREIYERNLPLFWKKCRPAPNGVVFAISPNSASCEVSLRCSRTSSASRRWMRLPTMWRLRSSLTTMDAS